jgi:hypothetical protein
MQATGPRDASRQESTPGAVGNQVVGVLEQLRADPRFGQHLGRVYAQVSQDRQKRHGAPDA